MVGNSEHSGAVLGVLSRQIIVVVLHRRGVKSLGEHHFLQQNDGTHGVIQSQLVLVQLRKHGANIEMSVGLGLGALQTRLNSQCTLQEVECRAHLSDSSIIACHVVECHRLSQLIRLTQFF